MRFERQIQRGTLAIEVQVVDASDGDPNQDLAIKAFFKPRGRPSELLFFSSYATFVGNLYMPYGFRAHEEWGSHVRDLPSPEEFATKDLARCIAKFQALRKE